MTSPSRSPSQISALSDILQLGSRGPGWMQCFYSSVFFITTALLSLEQNEKSEGGAYDEFFF